MRTVGAEGRDAGAPGPASAGRRRPVQFTSFLSKFLPKCLIFYYYYFYLFLGRKNRHGARVCSGGAAVALNIFLKKKSISSARNSALNTAFVKVTMLTWAFVALSTVLNWIIGIKFLKNKWISRKLIRAPGQLCAGTINADESNLSAAPERLVVRVSPSEITVKAAGSDI